MNEWIGDLQLRLMLAVMLRRMRRAGLRSAKVRALLAQGPFALQIRTRRGAGGCFLVAGGRVRLSAELVAAPDFEMTWRSGRDAFRGMAARDETELLRAFERGQCRMAGDFRLAMWLNEVMKLARAH